MAQIPVFVYWRQAAIWYEELLSGDQSAIWKTTKARYNTAGLTQGVDQSPDKLHLLFGSRAASSNVAELFLTLR
jgi:hypothetical protein